MPRMKFPVKLIAICLFAAFITYSCTLTKKDNQGQVNPVEIPAAAMNYVVFAWSAYGIQEMNAAYDAAVILPPYVTLRAQVIKRGSLPEIVTAGVRVEYRFPGNTYSYGKRDYAQFWDFSEKLFGFVLPPNRGLNFENPGMNNGLSGVMMLSGKYYQAVGVPLTPVDDTGTWSPYQTAEVVVLDEASGRELARAQFIAGTSDELSCSSCHGKNEVLSVLETHDKLEQTTLADDPPVLCASCHGSPFYGPTDPGSSGRYLSDAIHFFHYVNPASSTASCTDCHVGAKTKFNRSKAHTSTTGNCTTCHGTMANIAYEITGKGRKPWLAGPKCVSCHTFVAEVDTGTTLYSQAPGHSGVACASCHGTGHAMIPTSESKDHAQALAYQNKAVSIGSCRVCHVSSKGGGLNNFMAAHGTGSTKTSCYVCHTTPPPSNNPAKWPHRFQWRVRQN